MALLYWICFVTSTAVLAAGLDTCGSDDCEDSTDASPTEIQQTMAAYLLKLADLKREQSDEFCQSVWRDDVQAVKHGSAREFHDVIAPLLNGTWMTYFYVNESDPDEGGLWKPRGWRLIKARYPARQGGHGLHTLVFQNEAMPEKIFFTIRGSMGGPEAETGEQQADICGGIFAYDHHMKGSYCNDFTEYEQNYLAQLVDFILEVKADLPDQRTCFAFVGHSLGALMGQLASGSFEGHAPAFVFSGPGAKHPARRLGIPQRFENSFQIYGEFDPVVVSPNLFSNQSGWDCPIRKSTLSINCFNCFMENTFSLTTMGNNCGKCFMTEHWDDRDLTEQLSIQNTERPTCEPFPEHIDPCHSKLHLETQAKTAQCPFLR